MEGVRRNGTGQATANGCATKNGSPTQERSARIVPREPDTVEIRSQLRNGDVCRVVVDVPGKMTIEETVAFWRAVRVLEAMLVEGGAVC